LVLGNEGAGVIEDAGETGLAAGSRVMFMGPYGVGENGTWQDWLLVMPEHLADAIDDVVAASVPVALSDGAGHADTCRIQARHDRVGSRIGGSVGNASFQLARRRRQPAR
jgi:NADPH:quinone reductase